MTRYVLYSYVQLLSNLSGKLERPKLSPNFSTYISELSQFLSRTKRKDKFQIWLQIMTVQGDYRCSKGFVLLANSICDELELQLAFDEICQQFEVQEGNIGDTLFLSPGINYP